MQLHTLPPSWDHQKAFPGALPEGIGCTVPAEPGQNPSGPGSGRLTAGVRGPPGQRNQPQTPRFGQPGVDPGFRGEGLACLPFCLSCSGPFLMEMPSCFACVIKTVFQRKEG